MRIVHLSAECYPILKAGGLGDVVGSLPKYLQLLDLDNHVIVPYHRSKFVEENKFSKVYEKNLFFGQHDHAVTIWKEDQNSLGFHLYLVEVPYLFPRDAVYGYDDDSLRFIFFQIIALQFINQWEELPSIVHCHDHHTGLVPFMMKYAYDFHRLRLIPSVYTIHNGEYMGNFNWENSKYLPAYNTFSNGYLDYNGQINPMVSAIKNAYVVTTVSEGYLTELAHTNNATGITIAQEMMKSVGILNGIDTQIWNPLTDVRLVKNYDKKNVNAGKLANKKALTTQFGLDINNPLFVFIGRMVHEKGVDIVPNALYNIMQTYKNASFLLIGTGSPHYQDSLQQLHYQYPENINTYIGYNEDLAHLAYAGADFLMMPSRVEPCGLNQLYSMRYGTIPVVREVGGLRDTVKPIEDNGAGFTFYDLHPDALADALGRAIRYYHKGEMTQQIQSLMEYDFSWEKSAEKYKKIYQELINISL